MFTYCYSFFTDPTISTLTSGTPSQNVDLAGLSFPRRLGFKLRSDFAEHYHLVGLQCFWEAFEDDMFTKSLGKDFTHQGIIDRTVWCKYYFKGIFPKDYAYLKCEIRNPQTRQLVRTFYFKFTKSYQTSLDGRTYVKDPILQQKVVKNGLLTELRPFKNADGKIVKYKPGHVGFKVGKMADLMGAAHKETTKVNVIEQYLLRYSEKPKIVFLVTPPHLMKYAKLLLILITQLVNLNFEQSYMTKESQKPFILVAMTKFDIVA